jgi:K+-transporting ATPase KdpF subunit
MAREEACEMNLSDLFGGVIALLLAIYLFWTLLRPEDF